MTEYVWLTLCTCHTPPAVYSIATPDRDLDCCAAQSDRRSALVSWIRGMIGVARDAGLSDAKILADFTDAAERFAAEWRGEIDRVPIPTSFPTPMDWADQLGCVLAPLAGDPADPAWFEQAARDAVKIAVAVLADRESV